MKKTVALFFIVPLSVFVSCDELNTVQVIFDSKTFHEQRALWQASNVINYQYDLNASGFIGYSGTIFVENGTFKKDEPQTDWDDINDFLDYSTIDKAYAAIEDRFLAYHNTQQSSRDVYYTEIIVEYDTAIHIPTKIIYKYHSPPNVAVDGTFHFEIKAFASL